MNSRLFVGKEIKIRTRGRNSDEYGERGKDARKLQMFNPNLTREKVGGGLRSPVYIFHRKSPAFAMLIIQNSTQLTPLNFRTFYTNASTIIWLFQMF